MSLFSVETEDLLQTASVHLKRAESKCNGTRPDLTLLIARISEYRRTKSVASDGGNDEIEAVFALILPPKSYEGISGSGKISQKSQRSFI